jgi:uncharacterized protein YciI
LDIDLRLLAISAAGARATHASMSSEPLFIVLLRFSSNRDKARELMAQHNEWLARGFEEGVFLLAGSVQPREGGAILARNTTRSDVEARVVADPFVQYDVVKPEIIEVSVSKTDARVESLRSGS